MVATRRNRRNRNRRNSRYAKKGGWFGISSTEQKLKELQKGVSKGDPAATQRWNQLTNMIQERNYYGMCKLYPEKCRDPLVYYNYVKTDNPNMAWRLKDLLAGKITDEEFKLTPD
jgi:hypothetical protein